MKGIGTRTTPSFEPLIFGADENSMEQGGKYLGIRNKVKACNIISQKNYKSYLWELVCLHKSNIFVHFVFLFFIHDFAYWEKVPKCHSRREKDHEEMYQLRHLLPFITSNHWIFYRKREWNTLKQKMMDLTIVHCVYFSSMNGKCCLITFHLSQDNPASSKEYFHSRSGGLWEVDTLTAQPKSTRVKGALKCRNYKIACTCFSVYYLMKLWMEVCALCLSLEMKYALNKRVLPTMLE